GAAPSVDVPAHQRGDRAAAWRLGARKRVGHSRAVVDGMVLVELELEFDARRLEAEADDAAQLAPVVFAIVLETPRLPDSGREMPAQARDEVGKAVFVI